MPTRDQVRRLLDSGLDYEDAGRRLGIPAGQAYLIATGLPADGSDTITPREAERPGFLPGSQRLANPPHENPTANDSVRAWMRARAEADQPMRAAMRDRALQPPETEDETRDAISILGRQHNQVRHLLKELQALPSHTTGGTPGQVSARKSIVDMITGRLSAHEALEERYFWPAVRKYVRDGDRYADQALQQEREGSQTLAELGKLDPDSREFDEHVERLVGQLRKHVAFESEVFLRAREAMSARKLSRLGEKLRSAPPAGLDGGGA